MNLLIFNWRDIKHSWAGGSELYIHELAKRLIKKGFNITLFCGQDVNGKLPNKEKRDGILIIRRGSRFTVYIWALIYYFKELRKKTDIILDVENGIAFFTPIYSRKKIISLVYHVHGQQFFYELNFPLNRIGYFIEKYIFPIVYRNKKVIAISKSTKRELVKIGFENKRIKIIEQGISIDKKNLKKTSKYKKPTII